MTIVHLSSSLGIGGAGIMIFEMAKQSKVETRTIVISVTSNNSLEERFKDLNIEYHFLNINSFKNKTLINGIKKLNLIVNDINDDIVFHCHQFHGFLLGFLYNLFYPKNPIIFTLHTSAIKDVKRKIILFLTKPFRKIDIIFSKNTRLWYLKNNAIIPNGVDFKKLEIDLKRSYAKTDDFSFLYLGRLSQEKNPLFMISAALYLREKQIYNFVFDVVGDGQQMKQLKELIKKNNLNKHFNLWGFQKDIKKFLVKSHCLILPSYREGMPVVIIEAATVKLPVIATPVGSIPDFMNEANGYLSPLENFVDTMVNLMNDYETALEKADKLYIDSKNTFDIKTVYKEHLKLYKSI